MSLSSAEIEAVVRRVLDQIQSPGDRAASQVTVTPTANAAAGPLTRDSSTKTTRTITLAGRVVTARVVEEAIKTAAIQSGPITLHVEPGAIVTPAARDALRAAGVTGLQNAPKLTSGTFSNRTATTNRSAQSPRIAAIQGSAPETSTATSARTLCVVSESAPVFESTWKSVAVRGDISRVLAGDYADATRNAVAAIARAEFSGAFVLTSKTAAAAALANRAPVIRAAAIHSAEEMPGIIADMQPNVWIIDPKRQSFSSFRRILLEGFSR